MRKNVLRLSFFSFYSAAVLSLFWTIYPIYLRDLGLSGVQFGGLGAIMSFVGGIVSLTLGRIVDRMRVRGLLISLEAASTPILLLVMPGKMSYLVAFAVLNGLIGNATWVTMSVMVSRSAEDVEHDFPIVYGMNSLGWAAGGALGWLPKMVAGGRPTLGIYRQFILASALLYLAGLLILLGLEEPGFVPREPGPIEFRPFSRVLAVDALIGLGAGMAIHNFDFYLARKFGITTAELGTLVLVENTLMGLFNLRAKWFSKKIGGPIRLYLISSVPAVALLALIPFLGTWEEVMVVAAARTVLMNIVNPIYSAALLKAFGPRLYGTLTGARNLTWSFSIAPGRLIGGYLMDLYLDLPLFATAAMYSAALLLVGALVSPLLAEGVGKELGEGELPGEAPPRD